MVRSVIFLLILTASLSCSKNENELPPVVIPNVIDGALLEVNVTPQNITTPDKGSLLISMQNTIYKVDFNAVAQPQSNATMFFASDTVLRDDSREFASFGKDAVSYNPVGPNELTIRFTDGRRVSGLFTPGTSFGGVFGEQLIAQWRNPADPSRPNQKARDDISNFIKLYRDMNGPAPGISPVYLFVEVLKQ